MNLRKRIKDLEEKIGRNRPFHSEVMPVDATKEEIEKKAEELAQIYGDNFRLLIVEAVS